MCGIFGIIQQKPIDPNAFEKMATSTKHRGPNHTGTYINERVAIGNNRLAIIDLASGNQPIFNEDQTLVIVFNGEIYNHLELREQLKNLGHIFKTSSDTETILHAYEEFGPQCVLKLNGMFAFAIWHIKTKKMFIARDRLGIKPLYLANIKDGIAFASEAKAILHLLPKEVQPNWNSISRYFSFGYFPAPDSPFSGISKLPQGTYTWIENGKLSTTTYWEPKYGNKANISFEEACTNVSDLIEKAVKAELLSEVPVGIFLSGGLDSSAVAYFAKKNSPSLTHTFSLGFQEKTHDESTDARLVAEHLGLTHHELMLTPEILKKSLEEISQIMDEPFGDSTVLPLLVLSKFAKEYVTVALTGWGGDEIFAGYPTYFAHRIGKLYRKLPDFLTHNLIPKAVNKLPVGSKYMSFDFKAKRFIKGINLQPEYQHFEWMGYFDDSLKKSLFTPDIQSQITESTLLPVEESMKKISDKDLISRIMNLDSRFFLEGNGLFQADRITMAASLEARVPLLNIYLLDYVNSLPIKLKMHHGKLKELLRQIMTPYLPQKILNKPKKGFGPPSSSWVKGVFADLIKQIFRKKRVEKQGIFNSNTIAKMLYEHENKIADHGRNIWALLSFQLWYDTYILKQGFTHE